MNQDDVRDIAREAALQAIEEFSKRRKRGRVDTSGGDQKIGSYLTAFREAKGLSISELGKDAGLHPTSIGKIESGQRGMSLKTFCRLAYRLDEKFADLVVDQMGS